MPELHKLTPPLGVLQARGYRVALVTDGRMSGASGKIPAAIHLTPECEAGGMIGRIRDGDMILLDARQGVLDVGLSDAELQLRAAANLPGSHRQWGLGRELFDGFRARVSGAEQGAMSIYIEDAAPAAATEQVHAHEN
jgi:phosphogluconate dehydratase